MLKPTGYSPSHVILTTPYIVADVDPFVSEPHPKRFPTNMLAFIVFPY
jgi:hypothetical protein